jgi:hypothetical protein
MRIGLAQPLLLAQVFFAVLQSQASDLALVGAKIYLSPSQLPIENGTFSVYGGHILSVGAIATIRVQAVQEPLAAHRNPLLVRAAYLDLLLKK